MILSRGTEPQNRESQEDERLSPIKKYWPSGTCQRLVSSSRLRYEVAGSRAELRSSVVERLAVAQKSAPLSRRLVGEAATACRVSERTMWRWIAEEPKHRDW